MMKKLIMLTLTITIFSGLLFAKDYKGAEVFSFEAVQYGKFEIRMKAAYGSGTLSTFFLYDNLSWQGLPYEWREIDIEILGKDYNCMQTNIITGHSGERVTTEELHFFNQRITEKFFTYTIEWTPDYVAWYLDGKLVRKDKKNRSEQISDLTDTPQTYRMNLWAAEWVDWVGALSTESLPVYQYVNWIKYYEYTPGTGTDRSDFTLSWVDDFDTFDESRWGKANWSFGGNLADFAPENVVVRDGYLILCLTEADTPGYQEETVPEDKEEHRKSRGKRKKRIEFITLEEE